MADGHGGYRRPERPAPVSGPGKYSERTDGLPKFDVDGNLVGDPLKFLPNTDSSQASPTAPAVASVWTDLPPALSPFMGTHLRVESQRPGEPDTTGSPFGKGPMSVKRKMIWGYDG